MQAGATKQTVTISNKKRFVFIELTSDKIKFLLERVKEPVVLVFVMLSEAKHLGFECKKEILHCAMLRSE